ncbi:MAG: hypothetical protein WC640_02020 [Candidatus Paceibacterota bacterium]|jgi:hypothetical protein
MKKYILILSLLTLFGLPSLMLATSGTCSSHGGVSCSSGSDYDGSTICNDGWRDSTEYYSSVSLCSNTKITCSGEEYNQILKNLGYFDKQKTVDSLMSEMKTMTSQQAVDAPGILSAKSDEINRNVAIQVLAIQPKVMAEQAEMRDILTRAQMQCEAMGAESLRRRQNEWNKEILNKIQEPTCPANSAYSNGMCYCNKGFVQEDDTCKTYDQACQDIYHDPNVIPFKLANGQLACKCKPGYSSIKDNYKCSVDGDVHLDETKKIPSAIKTQEKTLAEISEKTTNKEVLLPEIKSKERDTSTSSITKMTSIKTPWFKKVWNFIWRF